MSNPTMFTPEYAGFCRVSIPLKATSYVLLIEPEYHGQKWCGLLVDGTFYGLVLWKHTLGRPEHDKALDDVYQQVCTIIQSLA